MWFAEGKENALRLLNRNDAAWKETEDDSAGFEGTFESVAAAAVSSAVPKVQR